MKKAILLLFFLPCIAFGQTTAIPDSAFEQALISLGYDDVIDGSVLTTNISGITTLDIKYEDISDLSGIQNFAALDSLICYGNNLTSLDVSNNSNLTHLHCGMNEIKNLNLSANHALTWLHCQANQLTCLNVKNGNNHNFTVFWAEFNDSLTCIEVDDSSFCNNDVIWYGGKDIGAYFGEDCNNECSGLPPLGLEEITKPKHLLNIYDLLGRPSLPVPNQILLYKYSDGSVEKKIQLDR